MTDSKRSIFDELDRLQQLKIDRARGVPGKVCSVYSPAQPCAGSKCTWYDKTDGTCWVLNPKPKRSKF